MIRPAVASIQSPNWGTAFAIDACIALTACHNVLAEPDDVTTVVETLDLQFPAEENREATVVDFDAVEDWAILQFAEPLPPILQPLTIDHDARPGDLCRVMGYPRAADEYRALPLSATFWGETERSSGAEVMTLEAPAVAAGLNPQGISGGPVIRLSPREEVVGLVIRRLLDDEEAQIGGLLFACPIRLPRKRPAIHLGERLDVGLPDVSLPGENPPGWPSLVRDARRGNPSAAARLGQLLLARDRREEAEPWLRKAALAGDPAAAYTLGTLIDPDGMLIDYAPQLAEDALAWFRRAATSGNVFGITTMGIRLRQHGRDDAAVPWLEEAVERGDAMAAHTLGRIHEDRGRYADAERLEAFAAEQGDIRAAYDLGRMLSARGEHRAAVAWLQRATLDPEAVDLLNQMGIEPTSQARA
jgi:tetratricopeptide (TPR) repeat protein